MAPAAGNSDGEAYHNTVFLTTSLDTRLVTTVSGSDNVSDFKERIMLEHRQCFPAIGNIEIHSLKVERRGRLYHLSDSMPVKSAFRTSKRDWFVSVDASSLDQDIDNKHFVEHKVGDLVALPWVTHNRSINGHHNHEPLSIQPKTVQTFSNTDGDSCKDVSQNVEEDKSSVDKQLAINKKIISKKRTRDVNNENVRKDPSGCEVSVKQKRKSQKVKSNVKATEENIVSTYDDGEGKDRGVSKDNENSFELKSKNKDLIGENTRINNGEKCYDLDQGVAVVPSGLEGVGRETDADVAMVVEKNIYENKKENELVQKTVMENEIPSSSTRTSDCERDATGLNVVGSLDGGPKRCNKPKPAEKEVFFQSINKDAIDSSQQDVGSNRQDSRGDLIDKRKEDKESSLKQGGGVKLPERRKRVKKSATKNKKQTLVMHADDTPVGDISLTIFAPTSVEKIIGEKNEVLETPLIDDSKKIDEMIVNEMEVSEPTNSSRNWVGVENSEEKTKNTLKDTVGRRKRKKDVEKPASKIDKLVVKQSDDVATSIDALHVDSVKNDDILVNNDVEVFRTEKNLSQVHVEDIIDKSEKQNGIIDGVKKDKKKKKNKKSASRNEDTGPQDWLSKDQSTEVELESKKTHHLEDISKNVTAYEVSKVNNEVDITNNGSHEINNFLNHFAPSQQPNKTASIDYGKDTKKPKKKTKDDSKNDIQSQKINSKNEGLTGKAKKNSKSSRMGPQVRLESEKSQSIDRCHHLEDTFNSETVSEVSKVNNKVDIITDRSLEINVLDHFAPGNQPNKTASIDDGKDTVKPKKKKDDSKNDGDARKIISKNEGLIGLVENNKSSETGPQDWLSNHQSTEVEVELESEKSQSIDHRHHVEDTSKNVTVSEVFKVNNEVDITNDESHEINFLDHFAPEQQPNETASIDNGKDTRKPKKKKKNDSKNDGDIQPRKIISENGVAVNEKKKKKKNKYSRTASQDRLSKVQSTEVELESEKSQSIDHHHHLEDTTNNLTVSEVSKVNNEVDITNDESHEINFMDHFVPGHQPNKTASVANKPKKINDDFSNDGIQSQNTISKIKNNKAVTDPNIPNIDQIKISRTTRSIDSKSSSSSKSFGRSHNQKSNKQQSVVGPMKKDLQVVNSLLNIPANIFGGDDSDRSSADDNATVNSDSSTRTPSLSGRSTSSSSSGEKAFSIEQRRNRSHAMNIKDDGGKKRATSQNESKNVSMTDLLRTSRFKKAKFSASQGEDTGSQPVDFVPESQLFS